MVRVPILFAAVFAAAVAAGSAGAGTGGLRTAVFEPSFLPGADGTTEFERIRAAGATIVRIAVAWSAVAPPTPAPGFDAANPDDPGYDWSALDAEVESAASAGLEPILDVTDAPSWALAGPGATYPRADDLGQFARAIAEHYSGAGPGVPQVRYWQLWNEPNLNTNLVPQLAGTHPVSPGIYRGMVIAFARAIKSVSPSNVVIIGGLAPYGIQHKGQPIGKVLSVAPLTFMRDLLCVSGGTHPHATCSTRVPFDVFSVHPYTWGGPTHSAYSPDDVAIGDLPKVQQVLREAWNLHRVTAAAAPQLWVTEFSWDTNPPDPKAIPIALQARWTAEALYRMWLDGVQVVTWFLLRDDPLGTSSFQSGLYFRGEAVADDRPKPTLTAFRFPFVAELHGNSYDLWGRTPTSAQARVAIELKAGGGWKRLTVLGANRFGIFQGRWTTSLRRGYVRARILGGSGVSLPFGLKPVPDRRVDPFGS